MSEVLSAVITFIVLIVTTITGPVYNSFQIAEKATDNYVNVVTSRFQKEVRNNGYVDYDMYLNFRTELLNTKRVYDVQMIHERKDAFPENSNEYGNYFVENSNYKIIKVIENKEKYKMSYGDNFTVVVKERELSHLKLLYMILYDTNNPKSKYIFAKYGGMIQNEE